MHNLFERCALGGIGILSLTHMKTPRGVDKLIRSGEVQKNEAKDWVDSLVQRGEDERQTSRKLIHGEVKNTLDELGLITCQTYKVWHQGKKL